MPLAGHNPENLAAGNQTPNPDRNAGFKISKLLFLLIFIM
jgi:hypothetical protein